MGPERGSKQRPFPSCGVTAPHAATCRALGKGPAVGGRSGLTEGGGLGARMRDRNSAGRGAARLSHPPLQSPSGTARHHPIGGQDTLPYQIRPPSAREHRPGTADSRHDLPLARMPATRNLHRGSARKMAATPAPWAGLGVARMRTGYARNRGGGASGHAAAPELPLPGRPRHAGPLFSVARFLNV